MIIKHKDDSQDDIDYLSDLLDRDLPDNKKTLIDRALCNLYSGTKAQQSPAYYLDAEFKNSKNWSLIHDLRIEFNGKVAQIDHLLIGRMMDVYVIESKNFTSGVSISDEGEFSYTYNNNAYSIPSPITENEQDIDILNKFLVEADLLPMRLGIKLKPRYRNIVLISPGAELSKPKKGFYDCSAVMKADKFIQRFANDVDYENKINDMASIAKVISQESLQKFSEKIVLHHKPSEIDYRVKFGLNGDEVVEADEVEGLVPDCPVCGKVMVLRQAKQGKNEGKNFWGCQQFPKCRGVVEIDEKETPDKLVSVSEKENSPACPKCKGSMVKRVSKKGKNAGKAFWGCKNFPDCRGVVSIE